MLHDYDEVHEVLAKDIGVLGVIVGTSILVDVAGKSGLFQFLAVKIAKRAKGDPTERLFTSLIVLTVLFVSLLTIAPGTLIVASLTLVLCRTLRARPEAVPGRRRDRRQLRGIGHVRVGHLHADGRLGGEAAVRALLRRLDADGVRNGRGSRGSSSSASTATSCEPTRPTAAERADAVASFDEWAMVTDRRVFWRSAILLGLTIVGFATAQPLGIGLDFVAMAGGARRSCSPGRTRRKRSRRSTGP